MKNEKRNKARQEARPKIFLTIEGWQVSRDERNWITSSEQESYRYFSTLENALWHISEQLDKSIEVKNLKEVVNEIKRVKADFLSKIKALSTKIPLQG